jgi:FAD:protein FMN transferase
MNVSAGWVSFPVWGGVATVACAQPERLEEAQAAVEDVIAAFDRTCSRFRADSELSTLNARAGTAVQASPLLLECLEAAVRAAHLTDGDVDPTVGEALVALGYDRDFAALEAEGPSRSVSVVPVPGWQTVHIDAERGTVTTARGVSLDLGATAKALGADRAAALASERAECGVLVSLGGDLSTAGAAPPQGWPVRVTDDHRAGVDAPGQSIILRSGGLATSSTTTRRWDTADGPVHHLVDPATGVNASAVWRTVSVAAASCLDANIASTAAIIRGRRAPGWLTEIGLPSRLVDVTGVVRHIAGWPGTGEELPVGGSAAA